MNGDEPDGKRSLGSGVETEESAVAHGQRPVSTPLWTLAVFALALAARLALLAVRGPLVYWDSRAYLAAAANIRQHATLSLDEAPPLRPTVRHPPLYPVFLAALQAVGLGTVGIAFAQAVLDSLVAAFVMRLALRVAPLAPAAGAGVFYALHPGQISWTVTVMTEPLFTALLVGAVAAIVRGATSDRLAPTALGGALLGLASLCRVFALPLPLLAAAACLRLSPFPSRRRHAALIVVAAAGIVLPWCVRSSLLAGRFVPVQAIGAMNVYSASRPDWGQTYPKVRRPGPPRDSYMASTRAAGTPDRMAETDRIGAWMTIARILESPATYASFRARHLPYLFLNSFDHFTGINRSFGTVWSERDYGRLVVKLGLLLAFSAVPLLLSAFGLPRARRAAAAALPALVWIYTILFHVPFWIEDRFWVPAVPFQLVSAAAGVVWLRDRLSRRADRGSAAPGAR